MIDRLKPMVVGACLAISPVGFSFAQTPGSSAGRSILPQQQQSAYAGRAAALQAAAERGIVGAMGELGSLYSIGRGVAVDKAKAAEWYEKAAEGGSALAMYSLAWLYFEEGAQHDAVKARRLLGEAHRRFHSGDKADLSPWVFQSDTGEQSHLLTVGDFPFPDLARVKAEAEAGSAVAMRVYASMHWNGNQWWDLPRNEVEALRWAGRAGDLGDVPAMKMLAGWRASGFPDRPNVIGGPPGPTDQAAALNLYKRAGEAGDAEAMLKVAEYYLEGVGSVQSAKEAELWMRRAIEAGDLTAAYVLGMWKRNGKGGTTIDHAEAIALMKHVAATGGLADRPVMWSTRELARIYENGEGVVKDDTEAVRWKQEHQRGLDAEALREREARSSEVAATRRWQVERDKLWLPEQPIR